MYLLITRLDTCFLFFFLRDMLKGELWKDQDNLAGEWTSENAPTRTSVGQSWTMCIFSGFKKMKIKYMKIPGNAAKCRKSERNGGKNWQELDSRSIWHRVELDRQKSILNQSWTKLRSRPPLPLPFSAMVLKFPSRMSRSLTPRRPKSQSRIFLNRCPQAQLAWTGYHQHRGHPVPYPSKFDNAQNVS